MRLACMHYVSIYLLLVPGHLAGQNHLMFDMEKLEWDGTGWI